MNQQLQEKSNLFVINRERIAKQFAWESPYIIPVSSMLFTEQNRMADIERLKQCNAILKRKAGAFSSFRGCAKMALITRMALSENPEAYFDQVSQVYQMLKKIRWAGSEHLVVAAMTIAGHVQPETVSEIVDRTGGLYAQMKSNHPFLTSDEDVTFAVLLALSGIEQDTLIGEMETCYQILKPAFLSSNAVQTLSHILALDARTSGVKCRQVMELYESLKQQGRRFDSDSLAVLGGLALLDADRGQLVSEIVETDEYLKKQKGFGIFGIGGKQRLMYAALLVMNLYAADIGSMQTTMITSVAAAIIAQETAMIVAITCTSAAMTTSDS